MEEIYEESITLAHWLDMDGNARPFGTIHVDAAELLCGEDRTDWSVRQEIHEATGNEGAELQRWYRRCALVIWPRHRLLRILAAEGKEVALPELERMVEHAEGPEALSACRAFAGEILSYWTPGWAPGDVADWPGRMLALLARIGTVELARQFIREVLPRDRTGRGGGAVLPLCQRFGWEALRPSLAALLAQQYPAGGTASPRAALSLLAPLYEEPATWTPERRAVCISLARVLADIVSRWTPQSQPEYLRRDSAPAGLVANAVRVLALGAELETLDRFVDRVLRGELICRLHEVLVPDVKAIAGWLPEVPAAVPAYARLREHCLVQLHAATAVPVEAPADWRRAAELRCSCEDCRALARFLSDPVTRVARFPLAEQRRRHLHSQIERHQCDCTHETERKGRPYTLVCTKTTSSYDRRKQQYELDQRLLGELERLPD